MVARTRWRPILSPRGQIYPSERAHEKGQGEHRKCGEQLNGLVPGREEDGAESGRQEAVGRVVEPFGGIADSAGGDGSPQRRFIDRLSCLTLCFHFYLPPILARPAALFQRRSRDESTVNIAFVLSSRFPPMTFSSCDGLRC